MTQITEPVGLRGVNLHAETQYIQCLLNKKLAPAAHRSKLAEDGHCGKNTQNAIRDFQQFTMKLAHPDSLVHPGKATYLKLIEGIASVELVQIWNNAVKAHQKNIITSGGAIKHAEQNSKPLPLELIPKLGEPGMAKASSNYYFPLTIMPRLSWHKGESMFGCNRTWHGPRKHAGCDLRVPAGTPVYAIANGIVRAGSPFHFHKGAYAVEIAHDDILVLYSELLATSAAVKDANLLPEIYSGASITKGQLIGYVGKMINADDTMVHFECYANPQLKSKLTDTSKAGGKYKRRADLLNPTNLLEVAKTNLPPKAENLDAATLQRVIAVGQRGRSSK